MDVSDRVCASCVWCGVVCVCVCLCVCVCVCVCLFVCALRARACVCACVMCARTLDYVGRWDVVVNETREFALQVVSYFPLTNNSQAALLTLYSKRCVCVVALVCT
jgi:hypothetical protein